MKIRSMRWGYDGGGMACGPVEGNTYVEIMVTDDNGRNWFVLNSRMSEFGKIIISEMPLFDIGMQMCRFDVDFDYEFGKMNKYIVDEYDYVIGDFPEKKANKHTLIKVIQLVRLAMQEAYDLSDHLQEDADKWIQEYVDQDLSKIDVPEVIEHNEDDWDEDDWDEDEDDQ